MSLKKRIEDKIQSDFKTDHLELIDESHMHSGNRVESHFKMILVSDDFSNLKTLKRHQSIYKSLGEEMRELHALSLRLYTKKEWQEETSPLPTPDCAGKN